MEQIFIVHITISTRDGYWMTSGTNYTAAVKAISKAEALRKVYALNPDIKYQIDDEKLWKSTIEIISIDDMDYDIKPLRYDLWGT